MKPLLIVFLSIAVYILSSAYSQSEIVIVDNPDSGFTLPSGSWTLGSASGDKYGADYRYATVTSGTPTASAIWRPVLNQNTAYVVSIWYPQGTNRAVDSPFTVSHNNGTESVYINQTTHGGQWVILGTFAFSSGTTGYVSLSNNATPAGNLILADAVKFETFSLPVAKSGGEFRSFWADGYNNGYLNASQCVALIDTARRYNYNAVVIEVRKLGDAYYKSSYEPWATNISAGFDALSTVIVAAHDTTGGKPYIEVYAWLVANKIWSGGAAPSAANHVYNLHPEWFSIDTGGNQLESGTNTWLDPGVPDANKYNSDVYLDVIRNYDIDGINFDYIRLAGNEWGYNTTAINRFNAEYSLGGKPATTNDTFDQWRRDNITAMVKRVYANAMAIKPKLKVTADTINNNNTGTAAVSETTTLLFQDWPRWMTGHILDANMPMIYKTLYSGFTSISGYDVNLISSANRHTYLGQGCYLVSSAMTYQQIVYARQSTNAQGIIFYSYADTNTDGAPNTTYYSTISSLFYSTATHTPTMSWKTNPTTGILKGYVTSTEVSSYPFFTGDEVYKAKVTYTGPSGGGTTYTDLVGFYSFMDVPPGTYTITVYRPSANTVVLSTLSNKSVSAGLATHVNVDLTTTEMREWWLY